MNWIDEESAQIPTWEGNENFLYLDSDNPPNATTGHGYLVASLYDSQQLPWYTPEGQKATPEHIADDWQRVKAMKGGMRASAYESSLGLHLLQSDINALTRNFVAVLDEPLHALFPAFDSWPLPAQVRTADMAYGLGIGHVGPPATGLHAYHQFIAAANATPPNFTEMAAQCARDANLKAFDQRNDWTKQGFLEAAST